jgi:hypothetical protein
VLAVLGLRNRNGAAEGSRRWARRRLKKRKRRRYSSRMVLRERERRRVGDLCSGCFLLLADAALVPGCQLVRSTRRWRTGLGILLLLPH